MSRIFISHSGQNDDWAVQVRDWLFANGWRDIFLDLDPQQGIVAGQRWQQALQKAAHRCEVVLALVTPQWLASDWCRSELNAARLLSKKVIVLINGIDPSHLPVDLREEQWVDAKDDQNAFLRLKEGLKRAGLDPASFPFAEGRRPYPGFAPLEEEDAAIFFGRDAQIIEALDKLRGIARAGVKRMLVILGASGAGKSSFLRAGLWPRMKRDDGDWLPIPIIRPERAVISGKFGLAQALERVIATPPFVQRFAAAGLPCSRGEVQRYLEGNSGGLGDLLSALRETAQAQRLATGDHVPATVVLSIDQAEELFNDDGREEANRFIDILTAALAEDQHSLALLTARSDAFPLFQQDRRFTELPRDTFALDAMLEGSYQAVIEGPAALVRPRPLDIDPMLTEALLRDIKGQDALPLLAFTLERLYSDFGVNGGLTLDEYKRLGGVHGSIEAAIGRALDEPGREPAIPSKKEEQLVCLRQAFIPWLARISPETGLPMRRVARLDEIPPSSRSMVKRLVEARLLIADRREQVDVVEVAHESLLRRWPALTGWLEADADDLKLVEGVERAAGEWARSGRLEAWLDHRAERLEAAQTLASRADFQRRLGENGEAYLAACSAREEAARREKEEALAREQVRLEQIAAEQARTARLQRVTRRTLIAIAIAVVLGLALGTWQYVTNLALQASLGARQVSLLSGFAAAERLRGNVDGALRLAVHSVRREMGLGQHPPAASAAIAELAASFFQTGWRTVLSGHEGGVWFAAFSPDGGRVVTASYDGSARIWDAHTGKQLAVLSGHGHWVLSAAFSSDGARIVTASQDGTARIWDAAAAREILVLRGHEGGVWSASFNRAGTLIVTASQDGTARVWDAETASETVRLRGHGGWVTFAAFSPDGSHVVTASQDGTARIWDAETAQVLQELRGHEGGVWSAAYKFDGTEIVTVSEDSTTRIWDAATAKLRATLQGHMDWVLSGAFSADGTRIVTASQDGTARLWLWDARTAIAKEIAVLRGHEGGVLAAGFSPDGKRIVTASFDKTARIWESVVGKEIKALKVEGEVWKAQFSSDGRRVVTASQDKTARIWDVETATEIQVLRGHAGWVTSAAFNPDGTQVVTSSQDGTARIWDAVTATQIGVLHGHEDAVMSAAFSNDGTRIVTASYDKTARIWDAKSGKELAVLRGHLGGMLSAAFNVDGTRVVTASYDNTARIWDANSGAEVAVLHGHAGGVWDAVFSHDGARIITASMDRTARIWDAATAKEIQALRGHEDWVWSADISADGTRIVTASQDKTARIWDTASGIQIAVLRLLEGGVWSAAFSSDGKRIVTGSEDRTARIWDAEAPVITPRELVVEVCTHRLGRLSVLTRDEMRLAGYSEGGSIDVCAAE